MTPSPECLICGAQALKPVANYGALPRVTSDCKPFAAGGRLFICGTCGAIQKSPDAVWLEEIRRIYDAYQIYQLSGGAEQLIFTDQGAVPRSKQLVEAVVAHAGLAKHGRLIDIGCGNGAALENFSAVLPQWHLYGSELSEFPLARLRLLPNFKQLFTVPTAEIPGGFDLVSMIHSLEHMPSPRTALADALRLLGDGGRLFVEVPDIETSPFDLIVADHLVHFSRATLGALAARIDISASLLANDVLPKEITLIGKPGRPEMPCADAASGNRIVETTMRWLNEVLASAHALAAAQPFGIFGTAISGTWLLGSLGERVWFFVDEDPSRIGKQHQGKPVLGPLDVPHNATVFVPLIPAIAERVVQRYRSAPARFVAAPPFSNAIVQA